jgi:hypothetical protein
MAVSPLVVADDGRVAGRAADKHILPRVGSLVSIFSGAGTTAAGVHVAGVIGRGTARPGRSRAAPGPPPRRPRVQLSSRTAN